MRSSTSSKSNKPQRKHSAAADTAEAGAEIAVTAVAAGDKVVVAGEEEAGARRRRGTGAREPLCFHENDHKQHHDTPVFLLPATMGAKPFHCSGRRGRHWTFFCWQVADLPVSEAFRMHAQE